MGETAGLLQVLAGTPWARGEPTQPREGSFDEAVLPLRRSAVQVDVNAGLSGGAACTRAPLHYAVQSDATDCAQLLLQAGAIPNTPQVFTETPLHVAAALGSASCVGLLLEHGADVRVQFGAMRATALHLAAEDGNAECARLLLEAGADTTAINWRRQTPLHLAAHAQSAATIQLLLARRADPNSQDDDGRTPLHCAIVKLSRSCDCVRLLLQAGAAVNQADSFGYTPLHMAALNEFSNYVLLLLAHGGDVTARTKGNVSVLSFIVRRTPDVLPKFVQRLDQAVRLHDHEIGDVDCELKMDFRILVPNADRGESVLFLDLIDVGQRSILQHPLCETFLFLKWRRIRKFFLLSLLFHAAFVVLYSVYVIGVYPRNCDGEQLPRYMCQIPMATTVSGYVLLAMNGLLVTKEAFQLAHGFRAYVRHWENWLQLLIVVSVFLCDIPSGRVSSWQHHMAALGIFLTWLELMMIVGRFPTFGLYVQMFTTVAVNFSKFLLAYCCLLFAFGLSFAVLFANYPPFANVPLSLLKTVVMMSGELEFEDMFYNGQPGEEIQFPYTAHFLFLMFVVLVTVILTNLLVGLAVSDIQGLQKSAGLDRLVRQAELVAHLESMLFSRLLRWLPAKLLAVCHRSALLLSSPRSCAIFIRPNDPREHRIPRYLVRRAYRLVAERRDRGTIADRRFFSCKKSASKT
ncbi:transient receptor potential channel pyrexia [Thrips palmi]|uniref:Transient receptor potential channel pyrexia n=1 Tax=Thrips palmi TaxID=161013 RepID=A0A6P9A040_THRPL|nr:transient receptor potential channel pyrexia [Thrips palmi]